MLERILAADGTHEVKLETTQAQVRAEIEAEIRADRESNHLMKKVLIGIACIAGVTGYVGVSAISATPMIVGLSVLLCFSIAVAITLNVEKNLGIQFNHPLHLREQ